MTNDQKQFAKDFIRVNKAFQKTIIELTEAENLPVVVGGLVMARFLVITAVRSVGRKKAPNEISDWINQALDFYDFETKR